MPGMNPFVSVPVTLVRTATFGPSATMSRISAFASGYCWRICWNIAIAAALSVPAPGAGEWSTKSSDNIFSAKATSPSLNTRWLNSRHVSLFCSGVLISHPSRSRHHAELHHHLRRVHLRPRLRDLSTLEAGDLDPIRVDRFVVRGNTSPRYPALVGPGHPDVRDDAVSLAEDVEDLRALVGERREAALVRGDRPLDARWHHLGPRRVCDEVPRDDRPDRVVVAIVVRLLEPAHGVDVVTCRHGSPPVSDASPNV